MFIEATPTTLPQILQITLAHCFSEAAPTR